MIKHLKSVTGTAGHFLHRTVPRIYTAGDGGRGGGALNNAGCKKVATIKIPEVEAQAY